MATQYEVSLVLNAKEKATAAIKKVGGALKGLAAVGAGVAVGGLIAVGGAAFDMASDVDAATANLAASLGITKEAAGGFEDAMLGVFANNFGDNMEDIADAVSLVNRNMKNLPERDLQKVTEQAFALRDAFGKDVEESTSAAAVLMEEFGLTGQQAMDFIAKGMQDGLDRSGDFLDTIGEYSNLFADGGASASQFFSLMETGLAGGALGTDKIADAFKEFQIGFLEISDSTIGGLDKIGLSYDELQSGVKSGSISMADAFNAVTQAAAGVSEENVEARLGLQQLGSQFEDLGSIAGRVDLGATSMEEMAGAADALNTRYETLDQAMQGIHRQAMASLAPIGDLMLEGLNSAMPTIQAGFQWLQDFLLAAFPILQNFGAQWSENIGPAMLLVNDAITRISNSLGVAEGEVSGTDVLLAALKGTLDAVIIGLKAGAVAAQGAAWAIEKISEAVRIGIGLADQYGQVLQGIGSKLPDWMTPGSPPPLFYALEDINKAISGLPSLDEAFSVSGGPPVGGSGTGGAGGGVGVINISIGSVTEGNAFNAGKQAGAGVAAELRRQGVIV